MIYLGVDLSYHNFDISAVSYNYTCLDTYKYFYPEDTNSIKSWMKSFSSLIMKKLYDFFCEKNYLASKTHFGLFYIHQVGRKAI